MHIKSRGPWECVPLNFKALRPNKKQTLTCADLCDLLVLVGGLAGRNAGHPRAEVLRPERGGEVRGGHCGRGACPRGAACAGQRHPYELTISATRTTHTLSQMNTTIKHLKLANEKMPAH